MKFYPLMPIIFIAAYLFVTISIYNDAPDAALNGLIIFLGFVIIYFLNKYINRNKVETNQ